MKRESTLGTRCVTWPTTVTRPRPDAVNNRATGTIAEIDRDCVWALLQGVTPPTDLFAEIDALKALRI